MAETEYPIAGGCTCGEIRYQLETEPLFVHCCHCTWCQRETGSAFVLNAMLEADRVTLLKGKPVKVLTPSNSGKGQTIWRCGTCLVAVWSHYAGAGDRVHFIRMGTLDDSNALRPDVHIFTSTKLDWVQIPADVPVFEEFYDPKTRWPESSLARMQALKRGQ